MAEVRDKEENLKLAVAAYTEALRVYTFDDFPVDYATTQNNLGTAYGAMAEVRDKEENLKLAVAAYTEALRVRTFDDFPVDYATTQNNLGTAYRGMAEIRDKEENLKLAVAAYTEALRVRTFDDFPVAYAMTMANLGNIHLMKGNAGKAHRFWSKAACIFEEEGLKEYAHREKSKLERLKQKI
jgi:tetratricopeptide (TPR) repeat protein